MSFGTAIAVFEGSTWIVRKSYSLVYWAIYGTPKTSEEKMEEKLEQMETTLEAIQKNTDRRARK